MSAATGTMTVQKGERIQCHKCGEYQERGTNLEVTADPDGWVKIVCHPCVEKEEDEEDEAIFLPGFVS